MRESRTGLTPGQAELVSFILIMTVFAVLILLTKVETKRVNIPNYYEKNR